MHVLFGASNRLGADIPDAFTHARTSLFERIRGRLRVGDEFFEGLAGLIDPGLDHRSHLLRNFETVAYLLVHGSPPVCASSDIPPGSRFAPAQAYSQNTSPA